jgi:hypothetical protein
VLNLAAGYPCACLFVDSMPGHQQRDKQSEEPIRYGVRHGAVTDGQKRAKEVVALIPTLG